MVAPTWGRPGWLGRLRPKPRDPDPPSARPTRAYLAAAAPGERRAMRPGTAGAEAGFGHYPRGLQMTPPTLPAHPGAEAAPAVSRRRRPGQPGATEARITPRTPPRVRIPPPTPGRARSQLRPPPTRRGCGLKDTLTPPRSDRHNSPPPSFNPAGSGPASSVCSPYAWRKTLG
jgi:hypothetical protein